MFKLLKCLYVQTTKKYDMFKIIKLNDMFTSSKVRNVQIIKKKTFRMYVMFQRTKGTICENH